MQGAAKMTNAEIKQINLDGFKDGFEAAVNGLAANMDKAAKEEFLRAMADAQKAELEKAAKIWDVAFKQIANG